jgi:ADP-ribose pyrophosphatase YjhB (NUDIX family)
MARPTCLRRTPHAPRRAVIPRLPIGAGVAITDAGQRVLLVQRRADHLWCLPGGHLEFGESFAECARRKCWSAEIGRLLGVYSDPSFSLSKRAGRLTEKVGTPDSKTRGIGWFAASDLPDLWPPDAPIVLDALGPKSRPIVR